MSEAVDADLEGVDLTPVAVDDEDKLKRPFYIFVIAGIIVAMVLGINQIIDKPIVRLGDVRMTKEDGKPIRGQVLARNSSTTKTYCIEITMHAVDRDGLTLDTAIAAPTTGNGKLTPGKSANFAATFTDITEKERHEKLDDVLAFVTKRTEC
jgi:hypothetical protein